MKNITIGIFGGIVTFVSLVGASLYRNHKSQARITINFDDKHRDDEKRFVDIWQKNKNRFNHMWISEDERFGFSHNNTRRYSFHIDGEYLYLLDDFIVEF